jgi:hypothetical protein
LFVVQFFPLSHSSLHFLSFLCSFLSFYRFYFIPCSLHRDGSKKLKQEPRMARHSRSPMLREERKRNK